MITLDPKTDAIPADKHPKLRRCTAYPLRGSCNYGETADATWDRCEFMKYIRNGGYSLGGRWVCTGE